MTQAKKQTAFLETYLRGTGKTLSATQATAYFKVKNLRARLSEMRTAGLNVQRCTNLTGDTAYKISRRAVDGSQAKLFS